MTLNEEIVSFLNSSLAKMAEYGVRVKELIEKGQEDSREYEDIMDKAEYLRWVNKMFYNTKYSIVDENMNQVYNFLDLTDQEILDIMADFRLLFELDIYPYSEVALNIYTIVQGEEGSGTGGSLPSSGLVPGYVLTLDGNGVPYWAAPSDVFQLIDY